MNNLFICLWSAALVVTYIQPSHEVPWRDRKLTKSKLVSNLEKLHIQLPNKTRATVPEASECTDDDCTMEAIVQDVSRLLYHQHTSDNDQRQNAAFGVRSLDTSSNSVHTPLTGDPVKSPSPSISSPPQCGIPHVSPAVPDIDQHSSPVQEESEEGKLIRYGEVAVRYGKLPLFPVMRVVGGSQALAHSWPWQVSLNVNGMHFCGGVILHKRWVVTAAHCALQRWMTKYAKVSCGKHDLARYEGEQRLSIERVILHKRYNRTSYVNDIALLYLKTDIVFNDAVSPICLPSADVKTGDICMITGWGLTKGTGPTNILSQVALPVIKHKICRQKDWNGNRIVNRKVFCAGYKNGGKDACAGDSGGPYACRRGGTWQLNGIISWGYGCAIPKKPGVFTRISKYVRWIKARMRVKMRPRTSGAT